MKWFVYSVVLLLGLGGAGLPIATVRAALPPSIGASTASAAFPYVKRCPDTDPYVDEANASISRMTSAPNARTAYRRIASSFSALTHSLYDCRLRILNQSKGEPPNAGLHDLAYISYLDLTIAHSEEFVLRSNCDLRKGGDKSKSESDLIVAVARTAYSNLTAAKTAPLQENSTNDDFLRAVSSEEMAIRDMVRQCIPDRVPETE